jgi:hypothetical protein
VKCREYHAIGFGNQFERARVSAGSVPDHVTSVPAEVLESRKKYRILARANDIENTFYPVSSKMF